MSVEREIPESYIVSLADQFADVADLLLRSIPRIVAPQALRVNAVFAVELYMKSLNCHWVRHRQLETLGVDCDAISVTPDTRGHKLDRLYDALYPKARNHLETEFAKHPLARKYRDLRTILHEYSDVFEKDRYFFEKLHDDPSHPISETAQLAAFFREVIGAIKPFRFG